MEVAHEPSLPLEVGPNDTVSAESLVNSSSSSSPRGSKEKENEVKLSTSAKYDYEDEEEEDVCRICRNPGDAENPLRYPCACSGSIKFVHQDCLLQWLNHSNARQCEVLPFSLSPL